VKFYVSAAPEVRALRRLQEHQARGEAITFEEVLHDLAERDARDAVRSHPAADAHLLDTSGLTIEQVLAAARRIVEAAFGARGV
jgi:cytidylate kinase